MTGKAVAAMRKQVVLLAKAWVSGSPLMPNCWGPDAYNTIRDIDCEMTPAAPTCPWRVQRVSQICAAVGILDQDAEDITRIEHESTYEWSDWMSCFWKGCTAWPRRTELSMMLIQTCYSLGHANVSRRYRNGWRALLDADIRVLVLSACLHTHIWPLRHRTFAGTQKL
jgi:hypothetical protein